MKVSKQNILHQLKRKWQLLQLLEIVLFAIGPAIFTYVLFNSLSLFSIVFIGVSAIIAVILRPWQLSLKEVSSYVDYKLNVVEYSSGLLLLPNTELSSLAQLQRYKISETLQHQIRNITPKNRIKPAAILAVFFIAAAVGLSYSGVFKTNDARHPQKKEDIISFIPLDSISTDFEPPFILEQRLNIKYPDYTGIPIRTSSNMNSNVLEGSRLSWTIKFNTIVDSVILEVGTDRSTMRIKNNAYTAALAVLDPLIYNFKFADTLGNAYLSELYAIEVIKDKSPEIEISGLQQFTSFNYRENKQLVFKTAISDDFGLAEAYIIATVSKGSGEAVKFREEKLDFDNKLDIRSTSAILTKRIDLDRLKMEPGDELYFYIEAKDLKRPKSNVTRSETFFAVIKDTLSDAFAVEATMGADLMPDYFRSQRQLIIDTEKLIADKPKIKADTFNFKSNELGFDQKALRLKYGEFMGDEAELGGTGEPIETEGEDEDPLAEFTHDHDGDNEHNLVEENADEGEESKEDPLEEYLHNHEDPEAATLFTQSLRSKLKQAMAEMWDAELYLRLFEPQKSLPYQYRALNLLQEIKNSARIYVHRIGFDPPPIKEEVRLTGEIDEIKTFQKVAEIGIPEIYPNIRAAEQRLRLIAAGDLLTKNDRELLGQAGNELAQLAIAQPGKYLKTLQQLKWLAESEQYPLEAVRELQEGLIQAIPKPDPKPGKRLGSNGEINRLLLKELERND